MANSDNNIENFLHFKPVLNEMYKLTEWSNILFNILIHLNPLNLVLKYFILNFDLFTQIAIEVQKYLNTRIYEINTPNTDENHQLRY